MIGPQNRIGAAKATLPQKNCAYVESQRPKNLKLTGFRNRVGASNEKNSIKGNFAYVENAKMTGL